MATYFDGDYVEDEFRSLPWRVFGLGIPLMYCISFLDSQRLQPAYRILQFLAVYYCCLHTVYACYTKSAHFGAVVLKWNIFANVLLPLVLVWFICGVFYNYVIPAIFKQRGHYRDVITCTAGLTTLVLTVQLIDLMADAFAQPSEAAILFQRFDVIIQHGFQEIRRFPRF